MPKRPQPEPEPAAAEPEQLTGPTCNNCGNAAHYEGHGHLWCEDCNNLRLNGQLNPNPKPDLDQDPDA